MAAIAVPRQALEDAAGMAGFAANPRVRTTKRETGTAVIEDPSGLVGSVQRRRRQEPGRDDEQQ
jgi:hypothetical protein